MFLLGEDVLKNMKFAIKGSDITEEISNAEIERFKGLADGIYRLVFDRKHDQTQLLSAFFMRACLDWKAKDQKLSDLDEFMISKIQC